jgi:hypothetical protein
MIGRGYGWIALLGGCALTWSAAPVAAPGQDEDREPEIKAAFLYNFGLYTKWPKEADGGAGEKFIIGVLGKKATLPFLNRVASTKTIHNRKIVVQHFSSPDDYRPCHVLFVTSESDGEKEGASAKRLEAVLKKTKGLPVLIVSESEGFAKKGSTINMVIEENKVRFEINPAQAKAAGLQISSNLLKLGILIDSPKK